MNNPSNPSKLAPDASRGRGSKKQTPEFTTGELVLGKYVVDRPLGAGGMGQVFRAHYPKLNRYVAVKVLPSGGSDEHAARFEREAALMSRVRHPNVVEIIDFGMVEGVLPCIVMELVEGEALNARLEKLKALPWRDAVRIVLGILDGLEAVHDAGVLHRDLKPSNVAIAAGPPEVVKLLDFGIARSVLANEQDRRVTRTGNIVGSLDYMAPEALVNEPIDVRADVYATATILYELITGRLPFQDEPMAAAFRRLSADPPAPIAPPHMEAFPPALIDSVLAGMAREKERRLPSALEFAEQLRALLRVRKGPTGEPIVAKKQPGASTDANAVTIAAPSGVVLPSLPRSPPTPKVPVQRPQFVIIATIPKGRLAVVEERRWLVELVRDAGRAYALGDDMWCAVLRGSTQQDAERRSLVLLDALESRYGTDTRVVGGPIFDDKFELAPNAEAFPQPIPALLEQLRAMMPSK
jgi:serine/threonine protein kinase